VVEFLKGWVLNIITLVMFIVLLEILLPSGKLKKIINLVSGFILIVAIVKPFGSFFNSKITLNEFQIINSNFIDKKELEYSSRIIEEKQKQQVTEIYRKKLINSIEERLKNVKKITDVEADIVIDENYMSENFGEIKKVFVKFKLVEEHSNNGSNFFEIKRIEVKSNDKKNKSENFDENMQDEVKLIISELLEIKGEDIIISIEKG
jgi:stage III sporulation protein AF